MLRTSVLAITPAMLLNVTTLTTPTCACGSSFLGIVSLLSGFHPRMQMRNIAPYAGFKPTHIDVLELVS